MNTKLAPKPAPKPGRVTVYRAVSDYCAKNVSHWKLIGKLNSSHIFSYRTRIKGCSKLKT